MTDEENMGKHTSPEEDTKPTDAPVVEQSQPVDVPFSPTAAHSEDEDPEQHLGEVTDDPWDDESQIDWPNGSVELPGVSN